MLYEQSLKQWQGTANTPEETRTAVLLAVYYEKKENKQQAIQYYNHAQEIWKKVNDVTEIKNIQIALGKLEK